MRTSLARSILLTCVVSLACTSAGVVPAEGFATPSSNSAMRSAPASGGATLTFRRVFKSSSPEFIEISVREDSDEASYEIRQLDDDPGAAKFEVSSGLRAKMFALAQQLNRFQGQDLDVHRKIANLGERSEERRVGKECRSR